MNALLPRTTILHLSQDCRKAAVSKNRQFVSCYPSTEKYSLLVLLVSVYENLSKNSLMPFGLDFSHDSENQVNLFSLAAQEVLLLLIEWCSRKRVQRYDFFRNHQNFSRLFSLKSLIFFRLLIHIKHKKHFTFILYIIRKRL